MKVKKGMGQSAGGKVKLRRNLQLRVILECSKNIPGGQKNNGRRCIARDETTLESPPPSTSRRVKRKKGKQKRGTEGVIEGNH